MIVGGSLHGGYFSGPRMSLEFEGVLSRGKATVTPLGSSNVTFAQVNNGAPLPCDVSPLSDDLVFTQSGEQEALTHIIHFEAGTDVQLRDSLMVTRSPNGVSYIGQKFFIGEVLEPSETIAYIRCHARYGKEFAG